MRGRSLIIAFGIILTISNSSGPFRAGGSVAQSPSPANEIGLKEAIQEPVAPIIVEKPHAVRRAVVRSMRQQSSSSSKLYLNKSNPLDVVRLSPFLPVIDRPEIAMRQKIIANEVLQFLPVQCLGRLESFYVIYDKPERRGLAGKSSIIMDGTIPGDEFRAVLIHEALGHVFDLGCLTGNASAGASAFRDGPEEIYSDDPSIAFYNISWDSVESRKANSFDEDFVSGYASSDPFEDLAESATYFLLHRRAFLERAQTNVVLATKLKWLETFMPVTAPLSTLDDPPWDGEVPWDSTKLPYAWKSTTLAKK